MTEQATETSGKRGRPRAAPTRMTTVNIPAHYHAPAPEIVAQIQAWFDAVDIQSLVDAALWYTTNQASEGHYKTYNFQVDAGELQSTAKVAARIQGRGDAEMAQSLMAQYKFSFRLPKSLYDQIQNAATRLSTKPSDIIRLALTSAYVDNVDMIKSGQQKQFRMSPETNAMLKENAKNKNK